MATATTVRVTIGRALAGVSGADGDIALTQGTVLAAYQFIAETERITQATNLAYIGSKPILKITQATVLALWRGRRENRKLRAWGFSLDGHDFYVLRLGELNTLVYDLTTGQWTRWSTPGENVLRAHLGLNWQGEGKTTLDQGFAWNIIGGDDTTGNLWILDPNEALDQDVDGTETPFDRKVLGAVPMRLRDSAQCAAIYVLANLGSPSLVGDGITLSTSDDNGFNWIDHGTVTVESGNVTQELGWLGLGLITSPGRLFLLEDTGAITRISSMDMRP